MFLDKISERIIVRCHGVYVFNKYCLGLNNELKFWEKK